MAERSALVNRKQEKFLPAKRIFREVRRDKEGDRVLKSGGKALIIFVNILLRVQEG